METIALAGVIVAGIGVVVGLVGTLLNHRWEEQRRRRDEEGKPVERSREVARDLIQTFDEMRVAFRYRWETTEGRQRLVEVDDDEVEPHYLAARRLAAELRDDVVRSRVLDAAACVVGRSDIMQILNVDERRVGHAAIYAARISLEAYLRGEPLPSVLQLEVLHEELVEVEGWREEESREGLDALERAVKARQASLEAAGGDDPGQTDQNGGSGTATA